MSTERPIWRTYTKKELKIHSINTPINGLEISHDGENFEEATRITINFKPLKYTSDTKVVELQRTTAGFEVKKALAEYAPTITGAKTEFPIKLLNHEETTSTLDTIKQVLERHGMENSHLDFPEIHSTLLAAFEKQGNKPKWQSHLTEDKQYFQITTATHSLHISISNNKQHRIKQMSLGRPWIEVTLTPKVEHVTIGKITKPKPVKALILRDYYTGTGRKTQFTIKDGGKPESPAPVSQLTKTREAIKQILFEHHIELPIEVKAFLKAAT